MNSNDPFAPLLDAFGKIHQATWPTIVIAIFTVLLFVLQCRQHAHDKKISKANFKLALFEKRMEFIASLDEALALFLRDGQPSTEAALKLNNKARYAEFLIPEAPREYIAEISNKTFDYALANDLAEPLRIRATGGDVLSADESQTLAKHQREMHEMKLWFSKQIDGLRVKQIFGPYVSLDRGA